MKVINIEKLDIGGRIPGDAIESLIARRYKVPKNTVELSITDYWYSENKVGFGYYIPDHWYPVVFQGEKGELIFIEPEKYDEYYGMLKETEG